MGKKYYWLKLRRDFFTQPRIKKLRRIAGGDTYTVIYLKLQLLSLETEGRLVIEGIEDDYIDELALTIDEDVDNVRFTVLFLIQQGLLEEISETEFLLPEAAQAMGSETAGAERVRRHRALKEHTMALSVPKTNAERQKGYRAKKSCEEKQHVPMIEDYINNKRYGGNYYIVLKRDKFKCACCGSIENLCVHHIDGYDENKPENSNANKMVALCRGCHSNIHAGMSIPADVLDGIDYFDNSNEMLPGNVDVTPCNTEKEIEKEIEREEEIEKEKKKRKAASAASPDFSEYHFSDGLKEKVEEWLQYKTEKRDGYKPTGLKSLLTQVQHNADQHGEQAVIELIDSCMAANWRGIIWDKLKQGNTRASNGNGIRDTGFETSNPFMEIWEREYGGS